jgi:hypothetical protein
VVIERPTPRTDPSGGLSFHWLSATSSTCAGVDQHSARWNDDDRIRVAGLWMARVV